MEATKSIIMKLKNTKNTVRKSVVILVLILTISLPSYAQIVLFSLTSNNVSVDGTPENTGTVSIQNVGITSTYFSINGWRCYGWNAPETDAYQTTAFSTKKYQNLVGSFQMKAYANTGPRDFKVQYKVGSGSWTDCDMTNNGVSMGTAAFSISTTLTTYTFSIPSEANNQQQIYIQIVLNSTYSQNGGAITQTSNGYAELKGFNLGGETVLAPTTQTSNISVVAVTPTTIKITASKGNGMKRIVCINTTNSFTTPTDDYNPSASSVYSGSGEQVIYNGSESSVTVSNIHSTNTYFFRIYDYNQLDEFTRFNTESKAGNPKECRLEGVCCPTVENIRLSRATLGATISGPLTGSLVDRGIIWSTTSPVNEANGNAISADEVEAGTFTLLAEYLDKGTTIYFKGYAINEFGMSLSDEASFSNVPVFSGTGNWEDASKWNVKEVPGANGDPTYGDETDSPVIAGTCTLTASNQINNLTIQSGKKLIISPAVALKANGTVNNNSGTSGLLIKASSDLPNGSILFSDPSINRSVPASVEMYSKAYTNNQYHWQYFGIPVQSLTVGTTFKNIGARGQRIRKYDESNADPTGKDVGLWKPSGNGNSMQSNQILNPVDGYEVVQPNAYTYTFSGNLFTSDINKTLSYSSLADWAGNHILANPYTGAIDIRYIDFGAMEQAVYLYNCGSREEWDQGLSTGAGTYTVSTPGLAGINDVPGQIPSMQGFLVTCSSTSTINIPYSAVVTNTSMQRAKKLNTDLFGTIIEAKSGESFLDKAWVFVRDDFTNGFDNGFDGKKLTSNGNSQLYSIQGNINYQISAVNDINNLPLCFAPQKDGIYTLTFSKNNLSMRYGNIYLVDLQTNQQTNISEENCSYTFNASIKDNPQRFKLSIFPTNLTNNTSVPNSILSTGSEIQVINNSNETAIFSLYSIRGDLQKQIQVSALSTLKIPTGTVESGVYIGKLKSTTYDNTERIIIK